MIVYAVFYTFFDDHSDISSGQKKEELVDLFLSYYDASRFVRDHIDYEYKAAHNDADAYWKIEDLVEDDVLTPTCTNGHDEWKFISGYVRYCAWGDEDMGHQAYLIYQKSIPIKQSMPK